MGQIRGSDAYRREVAFPGALLSNSGPISEASPQTDKLVDQPIL